MPSRTPRRKRKGTIALAAVPALNAQSLSMDQDTARVFVRNLERWLDNGHNLDAADVTWLGQEAHTAVAAMRAAGVPVH